MRTHKFFGTTSREVLAKVKQALGDDAIIVSNRQYNGRIEIMAAAANELDIATPPAAPAPAAARTIEPAAQAAPTAATTRAPAVARIMPPQPPVAAAAPAPAPVLASAPAFAPAPANKTPAAYVQGELDELRSEIQRVKAALQRDIAMLANANSQRAAGRDALLGSLLNVGFSAQLAKRLAESGSSTHDPVSAASAVAERLQHSLLLSEMDEMVTRGGVYALVGPTGAGKTTTVAKIAARAVVRFGAANVALLTTDGYRIGAHEQLRIYGRILDVPVHAVRNQADLSSILAELRGRHLVLIDTIGMSQRDAMVAQHATMLSGSGDVKRLLLLQTTSSTRTLEEVVAAYESTGVHGCILTKTDEAVGLAGALDVIVRHALPLHYVTDGQRVPEDLRLPDRSALVREAIEPALADALSVEPEDFPVLTASLTAGTGAGVALG
jgi:flagellar biosynthesis protein FlhF